MTRSTRTPWAHLLASALVAASLAVLASPTPARGEPPPSALAAATVATAVAAGTREAEPSGRDLAARRRWLAQRIASMERPSRAWHWTWVTLFAAQAGARAAILPFVAEPNLQIASGAVNVGAAISMVIDPLPAISARADLRALTLRHGDDDAAFVLAAERLLHRYADAEEAKSGWLPRIVGLLANAAAGAYMLFFEDAPLAAGLQVGIGLVVNEVRLATAPRAARHAVRDLGRSGEAGALPDDGSEAFDPPSPRPRAEVALAPFGLGAALHVRWR